MLIKANALHLPLADGCVQTCVTSPPYWGLRDYGSPDQLGLEPTPEAYVTTLVQVFREVRRVLREDGTVWLNLGDSYSSGGRTTQVAPTLRTKGHDAASGKQAYLNNFAVRPGAVEGIKAKDLIGIPWRVAFALQADGWYLRQDIIWHKPNPMPESVTDRCTKSHEYLFMLTKNARYYFDSEAIKEPVAAATLADGRMKRGTRGTKGEYAAVDGNCGFSEDGLRNKRSVWTVPTMPYSGAHFATFPEKLIEPCILAGCPIGGLVIDPFIGSGTVGAVCERLGRRWVGTDLSYQALSLERTAQAGLRW